MFNNILVICEGNICRSPTAAAMLMERTSKNISSAGLNALVDHEMDATSREVAEENGLQCPAHSATKLTRNLCRHADIILVMEASQQKKVAKLSPADSGKVMLFGKWIGNKDIPDPFKRSREVYNQAYELMDQAANEWAKRL